jgi:S1-C subfamily serine protease
MCHAVTKDSVFRPFAFSLWGAVLLSMSACASVKTVPVPPPPPQVQDERVPQIRSALYERVTPACVEILSEGHLAGSGWFCSPDGLVMTAGHVMEKPEMNLEVIGAPDKRYKAHLVALDRGHDLALIQVEDAKGPFPTLPLAQNMPAVGDDAFVFGMPLYRHAVLLTGQPARQGTTFEWLGSETSYAEIVHFRGASPQGTSGGPWINPQGEVIGLQSSMMSLENAPMGIAFVSPLGAIRHLIETRRHAETSHLGCAFDELWEHDPGFIRAFPEGTEGVVVRMPAKDSPAEKADLRELDCITTVDGKPVRYRDQVVGAIRSKKPGETIRFTVLRKGEAARTVNAVVSCLEQDWLAGKAPKVEPEAKESAEKQAES